MLYLSYCLIKLKYGAYINATTSFEKRSCASKHLETSITCFENYSPLPHFGNSTAKAGCTAASRLYIRAKLNFCRYQEVDLINPADPTFFPLLNCAC